MIVVDANILLYAYDEASPQHARAQRWVSQIFSGDEPVGLPWQTVWAFLRISTDPRLPGERKTPEQAGLVVQQWLDQPNVLALSPGDHHWEWLRRMMIEGQARGPLVTDAQLAAITIEHGGELYSSDRDFARFPGLRWKNPLA